MTFTFRHGDQPLAGYTVQRGVGRGGFGEVYYAVADSGKEVALKYLRDNPQIELRGVGHCLNLKSPHLVTLYDIRQNAEGEYFVIMEYISGPSLRDILAEADGKLGVARAAYFVREIAKGLAHLHDRGIVHRDLKPGNIFYEDGYVKIGDYGLSKFVSASRHSAQTASVGTVHYMAPEIGSGDYHPGTDIYAVGVMLYEMLLGRVPFEGSSMGEILMKHLTCQPEVDELPEPFPAVIRKALAKDPKDRYASVTEMVADVFGVDDIGASVASFEPASLSTAARHAYERVAAGAGADATPPRPVVGGSSKIDVFARRVADRAARVTKRFDARVPPAQLTPVITGEERVKRVILTAVVAIGLGCAAGVLGNGQQQAEATIVAIATLLTVTFTSLFGTLSVLPRVRWEHRWVVRLVIAGTAAPILLSLAAFLQIDGLQAVIPPLLITLVIVDWVDRVHKGRWGVVSFGSAISAALGALIAVAITQDVPPAMFMGVAAAASLAVQASASLWPIPRSQQHGGRTEGSSLVAAPFDPGLAGHAAPPAADRGGVGNPAAAARRMLVSPGTPVDEADAQGGIGMRLAAAGCITGAIVLFTVAVNENEPVAAACGVGCLVFAGVFGTEAIKRRRNRLAERRGTAPTKRASRLRKQFMIMLALTCGVCFVLAVTASHPGDGEVLVVMGAAVGGVFLLLLLGRPGVRRDETERAAMTASAMPRSPLRRSMGVRVFWRLVSAALISGLIIAIGAALNGVFDRVDEEGAALAAGLGFACVNFLVFSLYKSTARRRLGIWVETLRPFLLVVFISTAGMALATLIAIGDIERDEGLVALGVLVGALVFAWSIYRLRGDEHEADATPQPPTAQSLRGEVRAPRDETVTMGK